MEMLRHLSFSFCVDSDYLVINVILCGRQSPSQFEYLSFILKFKSFAYNIIIYHEK